MLIHRLADRPEQPVSHNPAIRKRVLLDQDAIPHLNQFAEACVPAGEQVGAHVHEDLYEVFLVTAGSGEMRIDDQRITLAPGCCITVEPGETHAITNTGSQVLILQYFSLLR